MDADEIRKWHGIFKRDDELFEIRLLGDRTYSGYFYDVEQAIERLKPFDNYNIYYSINEVKRACASRSQFNCFQQVKGTATSEQDIEHRWWLPIDVDCDRPSGVSSTDGEKKLAHDKAIDIFKFLRSNGFSEPVVCDSSSGYHLFYPIDIENTQESKQVIKSFLETLANNFTDNQVKVDVVLHDPNRIIRLPGTYGRKGRSTEERPHRLAKILSVPKEIVRMGLAQISSFNKKYEIQHEQPQYQFGRYNNESFDVRTFISNNGIEVDKEVRMPNGGTKFILKECPFDSGHKSPDSAIFVMPNGAIAFKCFHNSHSNLTWKDLRLKYDPNAYDHKQQIQQPYRLNNPTIVQQPLPQPVIKPETAELGKKWLSMKDIKKVNINEIEHFKTGFTDLDRMIKGLFLCELTIISGSNGSGKSSWLDTLILNCIQQGYKCALWSGELRPDVLKAWIHTVAAGKEFLRSSINQDYWYVPNNISEKIDKWLDGKFFLYNNEYSNKWEQIFNDMKELLAVGVKVFILDNLFSLDIDIFNGDSNNKQRELINQICEFIKKEKIHLILVAHPRKTTSFIRKNDISGTGNITNAADNVFIIHRVNNDFINTGKDFFGVKTISQFENFGNVIEVAKNRMMGVQDYLVGMYYEIESRRFKNAEDEIVVYGWRDDIGTEQKMFQKPSQEFRPFEHQKPYNWQSNDPFDPNIPNDDYQF